MIYISLEPCCVCQVNVQDTSGHICGATLQDKNWAMTAAHCVVKELDKTWFVQLLSVSVMSLGPVDCSPGVLSGSSVTIAVFVDFSERVGFWCQIHMINIILNNFHLF